MALSYSLKNRRDAEFDAHCDSLPDEQFGPGGSYREAFKALQKRFSGKVVVKGDPDYNKDRMLSNPVFDFHPIVIYYCDNEVDVGLCFTQVQHLGMPFAIRSSGHCTAGFSGSNGAIIDVSNLDTITITPATKSSPATATVGTGVQFGKFQQQLDHHGLNVPGGECSEVCVGGYVQGGGFGFTAAKFGISCDNIIEARVLLWNGSIAVANADQNADLLWALCGGTGGNFGIVISFTFELHPLGDCYGFGLNWALESSESIAVAADAMMAMQKSYMLDSVAGPDLTLQIHIGFQNTDVHGLMAPFLMVRGLWAGDPAKGPEMIAPLKALPGVLLDEFWEQVDSFLVLNHMLLHRPQGMPPMPPGPDPLEDKSSHYVSRDLTVAEWTEMLTRVTTSVANKSFAYLEVYGGAINQRAKLSNAFIHRNSAFNLVMDVFWANEAERPTSEKFLADWNKMVQPYWNGEVYQNYPSVDAPNYAQEFWGSAYSVLQRVKAKYDPDNWFTFEQQVVADKSAELPADTPAPVVAALSHSPVVQKGLKSFSDMLKQ